MKADSNEPVMGFSWIFPDTNLSCWQKCHLWYGPKELFSNPKQIIEKHAECFRFRHLEVSSALFVATKMPLGKICLWKGRQKRLQINSHAEATCDDNNE
jgi:hypothetical protein